MKDQVIQKLVFICDECSKKTRDYKKFSEFPYQDGWTYVHNFALKVAKDKQVNIHDKHYCSKECMIINVNKFMINNLEGGLNNGKQ